MNLTLRPRFPVYRVTLSNPEQRESPQQVSTGGPVGHGGLGRVVTQNAISGWGYETANVEHASCRWVPRTLSERVVMAEPHATTRKPYRNTISGLVRKRREMMLVPLLRKAANYRARGADHEDPRSLTP